MVAVSAQGAGAQIVATGSVQYRAAAAGKPTTVEPCGQLSLPADGNVYRVYCDYGTLAEGAFVPARRLGGGGSARLVIPRADVNPLTVRLLDAGRDFLPAVLTNGDGNADWVVSRPHELVNPPAELYARARLQVLDGLRWVDVPQAVGYMSVPAPSK